MSNYEPAILSVKPESDVIYCPCCGSKRLEILPQCMRCDFEAIHCKRCKRTFDIECEEECV